MDQSNLIIQKLIPKLINNLTGFKPNNENYKICVDYSWSQFKHHRYLSLNSHEVKRDIEGICQKFKLNHFHDEEKIIRKLFEQSLSHEISINHYQREVMYSIMNFLITLAYDPINKLKDKKRKGLPIFIKPQMNEHEENILTARKHFIDSLLQDNFLLSKNDTDSDLSEWTESEDEDRQKSADESEIETKKSHIKSTRLQPPQKPSVYEKVKLNNTLKWLKDNVQNSWWNIEEMTDTGVSSSHKAANFYTDWQRHLTRKSLGFIKPPPVSLLSEYCLLRETLWMFLNPVNCKFFKIEKEEISLRQNVCLPSTTIESLHIFLEELVKSMNIMNRLKMSIRNALKNPALNHTLENYYGLIEKFLDEITEFFVKEEEVLKEDEEIYTIITLHDKMQPHSKMLNMLWNIHESCILNDDKYPSHIHALYLIANLHQHVHRSSSKEQKNLSLTFLLICLKTYLQIFDIWWTEARLHDSKLEFLVEKAYVDDYELIQPRLIAKCKEKAFYINDKVSSKITEDLIVSTLSCYAVEASFTLEVISKLDRIHEIKQIGVTFKSLYDEFMELIIEEIQKLASNKEDIKEPDPVINVTEMSNNEKLISDIGSEMLAENDDIMYLIFNSTFESLAIKDDKVEASPIEMYRMLNNATDSLFMPLEGSLERIIRKLLAKKIGIAERFVMDIYFNEFQVEHYLQEVRKVYFLESNELINLFNMTLFPQMERGEKWANSYLLTVLFNETISRYTTLFTVHVNKILGHQTTLEAIDELTIYLNVNNNHFDNIFTSSYINKYNEVFRFLLKIKWALRILNCLRFPDFYKHRLPYAKFTMLDLVIKRLSLTRFSMQQAITMIHNNIMVSLQSLSIQFEENVAKTKKITDLIILHDKFVQSFHSKALLGNGSKRIRGIVTEMLKLAKVVTNEWHNIVTFYELDSTGQTIDDSICLTKLNVNTIEIENAFKICEKQLKDLLYY
ncbi:gamma-tubulin complex component 5-like [Chironomus tepperi]|uniref:gamma-tubulin complex component 5-like n=1 Tax=Chironomus tepperi TaxID=113505 RepID=UPI00391F039F